MRVALLVLALATGALAFSEHFTATVRRTKNPTIQGSISGSVVYEKAANRMRTNFDPFPTSTGTKTITEVIDYANTAGNGQPLRYVSCGTECNADNWPYDIPDFNPSTAKGWADAGVSTITVTTSAGTQSVSATRWNSPASDGSGVTAMFTNGNYVVLVLWDNNEEWHLSNHVAGGVSSIPAGWNCPIQKCGIKMDIVLLVDESGSIDNVGYGQVKLFVNTLFNSYEWGTEKTQFGVVFFSTQTNSVDVPMSADQVVTTQKFNNHPQFKGWTYTLDGLRRVTACLNGNCAGWAVRPATQASRVVVILTDGFSCMSGGGGSGCASDNTCNNCQNLNSIRTAATEVRNTGAYVFVVAVCSSTSSTSCLTAPTCSHIELDSMKSNIAGKTTKFCANNFAALQQVVSDLITVVCDPFDRNPCGDLCGGFCACGECLCPNDCADGTLCTTDTCDTSPSSPKICVSTNRPTSDNDGCTRDSCDPATGVISNTIISGICPGGSDPGSPAGACGTWACVGKDGAGNEVSPTCRVSKTAGACTDNLFCTQDLCILGQNQSVYCSNPPVPFSCANCGAFDPVAALAAYTGGPTGCVSVACREADGLPVYITGNDSCLNVKIVVNNIIQEWTPCTPGVCSTANLIPGSTTATCTKPEECCRFPQMDCDTDKDPCTIDTCDASDVTIVNPFLGYNKTRGTCKSTPNLCNDNNACTDDVCVATVGCRHSPSLTACGAASSICNVNQCFNVNVNIGTNLTANWTAVCQERQLDCSQAPALKAKLDGCNVAACDAAAGGCLLRLLDGATIDECGNCNPPGEELKPCIVGLEVEEAAAIGAGVLAAIIIGVIACVLLAGLGGAGAYKVLNKYRGGMQGAQSNPLFEDNGMQGESQLYDDGN